MSAPTDPPAPRWLEIVASVPSVATCLLLVLYFMHKIRCERLVSTVLMAHVVACLVVLGWAVATDPGPGTPPPGIKW